MKSEVRGLPTWAAYAIGVPALLLAIAGPIFISLLLPHGLGWLAWLFGI